MSSPSSGWEAWVAKAEHDLLAIENNIVAELVPWDVVAFLAQQLAEKYLKAYLILVGEDPPRIHDLPRLLALCMKSDPTLAATTDQCVFLSRIGAISRYPDNPAEPTEEDARKAVHLAREVREAMRARLPRGSE